MSSASYVFRKVLAWFAAWMIVVILWHNTIGSGVPAWMFTVAIFITLIVVSVSAFSHVRRVRLIADRVDAATLASRHRRRIEVPFPADEVFDLVDAAVRELPHVENVDSARDSLQVRAQLKRMDPYLHGPHGARRARGPGGARRNLVLATVNPGDSAASITLICEPEGPAWVDWFMSDHGTNLENVEAISRAVARRVDERRKQEKAAAAQTATQKELTVAKLSLLHAQVEPHFLYNTLASAQILARSDPAKADQMLGHLITYLRRSLPRTEGALATLGEELERAQAYLEIMKIRMGERLRVQVQVPAPLMAARVPPMMMQTLVENAIKHGLEPVPGGGTVWIIARETDAKVAITIADDGRGFGGDSAGTGVGLANIRERLRLAYGDAASFSIVPNFPNGVTATLMVPASPDA